MRAKKVFETIDFKRGQDSKRSLKVGPYSHPLYQYWMEAKDSPNFEKVTDIKKDPYTNDDSFEIYSKLKAPNEEYHKNQKEIFTMSYDSKADELYLVYDLNGNDWIIDSLQQFKIITRSFDHITESYNFKRTGNSKKGLGVGKYRYPQWTKPDFLNISDRRDLKAIWDHIQNGDLDAARSISDHLDTIVREEIPLQLWYEVLHPELEPFKHS